MPGIFFILLGMFIGWLIEGITESICIKIENKKAKKRGEELEKYALSKKEKNTIVKEGTDD